GAPQGLFAALGGTPTAGGSWTDPGGVAHSATIDPTVDPAGVYTYTVAGVAPCASASATVTVTITSSPNAGTNGTLALCDQGPVEDLFSALSGSPDAGGSWTDPNGVAHSNNIDPSTDPAGAYTYTVPAVAPCVASSAVVNVTIDPTPDAGLDGAIAVCTGDAPFALFSQLGGTPDAGGSWTDPNGIAFGSTFDPGADPQGVYTYTVAGGTCPQDQSVVDVTVNPGPDAGQDNAVALCSNGAVIQLTGALLGTPDPNGSWTDPNGIAFTGTFDPATALEGDYTYTVAGNAGCPDDVAVLTMTVSPEADAGGNGNITLCTTDPDVDLFTLLSGTPDAVGVWTDPNGLAVGASLDPSTAISGNYTYTVTGLPPCTDATATIAVTITPAPDAGLDANATYCNTEPAVQLFGLLGGTAQGGGSWTDPNGDPTSGSFDPASDTPGPYTYRVTGAGACADDEAVVTVNVSIAADAGSDGSITICSTEAPFTLFALLGGSPDAGGTWTAPDGTASNGTVDPATGLNGDYMYTVASPVPCAAQSAVVNVTIIPNLAPVITVDVGTGCAPVMASITSSYTGPGTCTWDLGNGTASTEYEPDSIIYTNAGAYDLTVTIDPGNGCIGTFTYPAAVVVVEQPTASFYALPDTQVSVNNTEIFFVNTSTNSNAWLWEFDTLEESTAEDPVYVFPNGDPGEYTVCLIAYASATCTDTACRTVVVEGSGYWVPNSFTPDGDGTNDLFFPVLGNPHPEEFRFMIFDRWGQPLFDTSDPAQHWTGHFANGAETPIGVYVWKLWLREPFTTDRVERTGHVTLLR
ncbi:MAG: gliding motility-associated C-terminal domain-containing protein, partial [Flavobacteriales bacterium]